VNVETKEQSKRWMHMHAPNKLKMFIQMSARKVVGTVFRDRKEVLMVEFMQQGTTITSKVYCETLKKNFIGLAIQNERCGMLTSGVFVMFLHDTLHPHTAACTRAL
jgi:hypothetical protein